MHRTEADGHVSNLFDPGDPFIPTPATQLTYDWANAVQEELCNVVTGLGGTLETAATDTDFNQVLTRLNAKFGRLDLVNSWAAAQTFAGGVAGNPVFAGNVTVSGTLGVTGNVSLGGSLAVTASTTLTGPATLNGATTVNATLVVAPSSGNTNAGTFTGSGSGYGIVVTSGATGDGGTITALGTGATGLVVTGGPTGVGLRPRAGTAATATTPRFGSVYNNGYIAFDGVTSPNSNVALKDTLTPANIVKAHALVITGGSLAVTDGCNIASIQTASAGTAGAPAVPALGAAIRINFAQAFANNTYTVAFGAEAAWGGAYVVARATTYVDVGYWEVSGGAGSFSRDTIALAGNVRSIDITVTGRQ